MEILIVFHVRRVMIASLANISRLQFFSWHQDFVLLQGKVVRLPSIPLNYLAVIRLLTPGPNKVAVSDPDSRQLYIF